MNDFLRAGYEQSRQTCLHELAAMQQRNDEYAEKNGGVGNLPDNIARTYEARKNTIIRLVAYHDRAQEYIEDLQEWVSELIEKNRKLAAELSDPETLIAKYFEKKYQNESVTNREYRRAMSIQFAKTDFPQLFGNEDKYILGDTPQNHDGILPLQTVLDGYHKLKTRSL